MLISIPGLLDQRHQRRSRDGGFALLNPKVAHQGLAAKRHGLQFLAEQAGNPAFWCDRYANSGADGPSRYVTAAQQQGLLSE